jgi:hypothetical protein
MSESIQAKDYTKEELSGYLKNWQKIEGVSDETILQIGNIIKQLKEKDLKEEWVTPIRRNLSATISEVSDDLYLGGKNVDTLVQNLTKKLSELLEMPEKSNHQEEINKKEEDPSDEEEKERVTQKKEEAVTPEEEPVPKNNTQEEDKPITQEEDIPKDDTPEKITQEEPLLKDDTPETTPADIKAIKKLVKEFEKPEEFYIEIEIKYFFIGLKDFFNEDEAAYDTIESIVNAIKEVKEVDGTYWSKLNNDEEFIEKIVSMIKDFNNTNDKYIFVNKFASQFPEALEIALDKIDAED